MTTNLNLDAQRTEKNNQPKPIERKAGYTAPEIFSVGKSADLIQGAQWRGPLDWPGSWPIYAL